MVNGIYTLRNICVRAQLFAPFVSNGDEQWGIREDNNAISLRVDKARNLGDNWMRWLSELKS